ncbi:Uncharacterised protein [BD1-7 clade bacterium]|uniref:Major facilitator superfamily (MFS) profile domain-containing protein n=1 Tax=BD1-7 clade bacterium TaxID=2029982 RepID=A0A5S9MQ31_9GAMM|nr:Uncharacterised protein [BD1-7 clade bacterium]
MNESKGQFRWGLFHSLIAIAFVDGVNIALIYPMMPHVIMLAAQNLPALSNVNAYTIIIAGFSFLNLIGLWFFLWALRYFALKKLLALAVWIGVVGYAICLMGFYRDSYLLIVVSRVVLGLSTGGMVLTQVYLFFRRVETTEKALQLSLINTFSNVGVVAAPAVTLVAFHLFPQTSLRYAFPFLLPLMVLLAVALTLPVTRFPVREASEFRLFDRHIQAGLNWRNHSLRKVVVYSVIMLCLGAMIQTGPFTLEKYLGLGTLQITYIYGALALGTFVGFKVYAFLLRRMPLEKIIKSVLIVLSIHFFYCIFIPVKIAIAIAMVLIPTAFLALNASLITEIMETSSDKQRLFWICIIDIVGVVSMVLSSLFAVYLVDLSYHRLAALLLIFMLMALVAYAATGQRQSNQ